MCWLMRIILIDIRSAEPEEDMSQRSWEKRQKGIHKKSEKNTIRETAGELGIYVGPAAKILTDYEKEENGQLQFFP
jgi:hypothetical protein